MTDLYTPSPAELGSPQKFTEWRDGQDDLFWDILDCQKRFTIRNAPVGSGKSLSYMTAAIASGKRVAVLTESKALQDQIGDDFLPTGLFDMRGLQNYTCRALAEGGHLEDLWRKKWGRPTCDVGPCTAKVRCDLKNNGCDYFDAWRLACHKQLVSTNYAYWIAIHKYSQGLGKFDWLVCDEAHSADAQVAAALSVEFTPKDFRELCTSPPRHGSPIQNWRMWSRVQSARIQDKLEGFSKAGIGQTVDGVATFVRDTDLPDAAELKFWKRLEGKCTTLSDSKDDWVISHDESSGNVRVAPVWVRQYAEQYLFHNIPRIIMVSATVRPKTAGLLGIDDFDFKEYPSTFPVERRPVFHIPTVALNHGMPQNDMRSWVVRIDQILRECVLRGWKVLVHTVSYPKQQFILAHSRYSGIMLANAPGTTRDKVKQFRDSSGPLVLVSPSIGTGFDFPYSSARAQIITKLPFRDFRDPIFAAQVKEDPEYSDYLVAQDVLQMYGRINRAPDDYGITFIIDDNIEWVIKKRNLFPLYFLDAYSTIDSIPDFDNLICV